MIFFQQNYYVRGMPVSAGFVPSLIPSGRYQFESRIVHKDTDETVYRVILTVDIKNKMLFNW